MILWLKFGGRRRSWPPHEQCSRVNSATVNSAVSYVKLGEFWRNLELFVIF
ncbi:hypothetical protein RchiOBHm_Chr5g0025251 [Rosa chinensis]|uniref:Uncharacterized protein n=1 Tax=Rosa chinensis TaxID=74649 RepID=A0A2P6Q8I7_ROSCH|nr:hypothetical protein RchiOBHm_Chr5g0025251 [Rosa chinensis]